MNDRELLEAAAKAAGVKVLAGFQAERDAAGHGDVGLWTSCTTCWNPLTDDGQALRLAAELNIDIEIGLCYCETTRVDMVKSSTHRFMEDWGAGPTMLEVRMRRIRRAIVRAAAALATARAA